MSNLNFDLQERRKELGKHLHQYLEQSGVSISGSNQMACWIGTHKDNNPSMTLMKPDYTRCYCYSCLPYSQRIWTAKGLMPIGDVQIGDYVFSGVGVPRRVTNKKVQKPKRGVKIRLSSVNNDPLIFTHDHIMVVVKADEDNSRRFYRSNGELQFYNSPVDRKPIGKYKDGLKSELVLAEDVKPGQFVIQTAFNTINETIVYQLNRKTNKGPIPRGPQELIVDEDLAWLMGLYTAEGNVQSNRSVIWTLNIKETYLADRLAEIGNALGYNVHIEQIPEKNTLRVSIHSSLLGELFLELFGHGAQNKRIPYRFLTQPKAIQAAFLEGHREGDGSSDGLSVTSISRELIYGLKQMYCNIGRVSSLTKEESYTDKDGTTHKEAYRLYLGQADSKKRWIDTVDGRDQILLEVESVDTCTIEEPIVDITVDKDHTFCTEQYYVHNCGSSADIFDAANILEGKPLNGKAFIVDNLNYLSKRFGYKALELDLSAEDERELKAERIHRVAAGAFRKRLNINQAKIRGWFDENACRHFGIGTIDNTDDFIQFVMKTAKVTKQDIEEAGIDIRMFAPHMLTFVLEDERGDCIGFASRNMDFERIKAENPDASVQKYLNPANSAPLYVKGRFLYNLNRAKKHRNVVLVEGYAEPFTAFLHGIHNIAAYGAALTFNEDKIEALLRAGVNSVILAGGYDFKEEVNEQGEKVFKRVGQDGTMKALKTLRKYPEIRARVLDFGSLIPEYLQKHPEANKAGLDEFILTFGGDRIKALIENAIPAVRFTVDELKARGVTDPKQLAEELIDIIAFEPDPLEVPDQIAIAAEHTGFDIDAITEAVKKKRRMLDHERKKTAEDLVAKFNRRAQISKSTMELVDLATTLSKDLEKVDPRNLEISTDQEMRWVQEAQERVWGEKGTLFYKTGLPFFDTDMMGGIPVGPSYILFPGDSQTGKSMAVQRIVHGLLHYNADVDVAVMASDDGKVGWLHRLWCMEAQDIPLHKCKRPNAYFTGPEHSELRDKLASAQNRIAAFIGSRRLTLRDSGYGTHINAVRRIIETHYRRTDRPLVMVIDGIHKLSGSSKQELLEGFSSEIKQMSQEFDMPFIVTAELRKRGSEQGYAHLSEPTAEEIKGTRQIEYDADAIYIMDNPVNRMRERKDQKDKNGKDIPCYKNFANTFWEPEWSKAEHGRQVHYPFLWTHRTKNKLMDEDGLPKKYYSKFTPTLMKFEEHIPAEIPDSVTVEEVAV